MTTTKALNLSIPQIVALLLLDEPDVSVYESFYTDQPVGRKFTPEDEPGTVRYRPTGDTIHTLALKALKARGLVSSLPMSRWEINDNGRAALAAASVGGKLEAKKRIDADRAEREYKTRLNEAQNAAYNHRYVRHDVQRQVLDAVRESGYDVTADAVREAIASLHAADAKYETLTAAVNAIKATDPATVGMAS